MLLEKFYIGIANCRENKKLRRKISMAQMKKSDKYVEKHFRPGGSLVRRHPTWLSENPLGFCISVD